MMLQAGTASEALAAACPAVTVAKNMGIKGKYPQQFELAEFEKAAGCKLTFSENPDIGKLNARIRGNPKLPDGSGHIRLLVSAPRQFGSVFR
jgi:hypothetical protein